MSYSLKILFASSVDELRERLASSESQGFVLGVVNLIGQSHGVINGDLLLDVSVDITLPSLGTME